MFKVRNLRPELSASLMKSTDHTWLAATASGSGWRTLPRFPTFAPQRQLLLDIQPVDAFVIHLPPFPLQQNLQTPLAEPTPDFGQLT